MPNFEFPVTSTCPGGRETIVLDEAAQGIITIPTADFERIDKRLPRCIQENENDAPAGPQYPRAPLVTHMGGTTTIRTRNTSLIAEALRQDGVHATIRRSWENIGCVAPAFDQSLLALTTDSPWRQDLLAQLSIYRYAQVTVRESAHWDVAAELCAAFPAAPLLFVVASHREVDQVADELQRRVHEPVQREFGLQAQPECRVIVATYWAYRSLGLLGAPFVVYPIWRPGFPSWLKDGVRRPFPDRIYFLFTPTDLITPHDRDGLLGRVGPELIIGSQDTASIPHTFSLFSFGGMAKPTVDPRTPRRSTHQPIDKRKAYWRHDRRNQALAALASVVAAENTTTALLVETAEHAKNLQQQLRGWALVCNQELPARLPPKMIITLTAANAWSDFRTDQLVFAAGGPPSSWLASWLNRLSAAGRSARVLDLTDGFSNETARLAEARQRAYRDAGCHWRPLPNSVVKHISQQLRRAQKQEAAARQAQATS